MRSALPTLPPPPPPAAAPRASGRLRRTGRALGDYLAIQDPGELLPLTLLALSHAAFAVLCLILWRVGDGAIVESEEWGLYLWGGPAALLFGLYGAFAMRTFARREFGEPGDFYPAALLPLACYWAGGAWWLSFVTNHGATSEMAVSISATLAVVLCYLMALFLGIRIAYWWGGWTPAWVGGVLPPLAGVAALPFAGGWWTAGLGVAAGLVALVVTARRPAPGWLALPRPAGLTQRLPPHIGDVLVAGLLIPTVIDPGLHFEQHSHNFYLGPVNDLLAGKTMLVDVFSQYGVLVLQALAAVFGSGLAPLSYHWFSLVLSVLLVAQFGLLYLLLRGTLRSEALVGVAFLAMVAVDLFGQAGYAQQFPSTGPLRFGPFYLLLAVVMLRHRRPAWARGCLLVEAGLLGMASVWSAESFVYAVAGYLTAFGYEVLSAPFRRGRTTRLVAARLGATLIAIALAQGAMAAAIYQQAGQWPDVGRYLRYVTLYVGDEFGTLPIDAFTPWVLIAGVYAVTCLALMVRLCLAPPRAASWRAVAMAGMAGFGLVQFTYFIGRSHPNNLYHVMLPALFLAACWLDLAASDPRWRSTSFASSTRALGYAAIVVLIVVQAPALGWKLDATMVGRLVLGPGVFQPLSTLREPVTSHPDVADAVRLAASHVPGSGPVAIFLDPEHTTEAHLLTRRPSPYPISAPTQAVLLPKTEWGQFLAHGLPAVGSVVVLPPTLSDLNPLQVFLLRDLCARYAFSELERAPAGVTAVRLIEGGRCTWPGLGG